MNRKQLPIVLLIAAAALGLGFWAGRVHDSGGQPTAGPAGTADATSGNPERKILYYRNPMGLADTSLTPKKDSMGMEYIPVYEGDEPEGPQVKISLTRLQKLGVRTEAASSRTMVRTIRAVGTIQPDERTLYTVAPRFEGWITKLFVSTTGASVKQGQPLFEVYSPDLVTAQEEYRIAAEAVRSMQGANANTRDDMQMLADAGLQRLRNWDIAETDLERLKAGGEVKPSIIFRAPASGTVTERIATAGMRFMPGEMLYRIADLSHVWMVANVFEQDLAAIHVGQGVQVSFTAYPGRTFEGKVAFVYPELQADTRTARVRVEMTNGDGLLKPDLYGTMQIKAADSEVATAIPESAVLDSGTRQAVLVEVGGGVFEPRDVKLGQHGDGYVAVIEGVTEGERVVVDGNFLIDADSNLKAALGGFGHQHGEAAPATESAPPAVGSPAPAETAPTPNEHAGH